MKQPTASASIATPQPATLNDPIGELIIDYAGQAAVKMGEGMLPNEAAAAVVGTGTRLLKQEVVGELARQQNTRIDPKDAFQKFQTTVLQEMTKLSEIVDQWTDGDPKATTDTLKQIKKLGSAARKATGVAAEVAQSTTKTPARRGIRTADRLRAGEMLISHAKAIIDVGIQLNVFREDLRRPDVNIYNVLIAAMKEGDMETVRKIEAGQILDVQPEED